jgi:hypothetical protein
MELGLSPMQAKAYINNGRWQRMLPGVYATFTGPVGTFRRVWAAILYAGPGAAASHGTALWLWKVIDDPPTVIDVIVPELRKVLRQRGLRVHRRRALNQGLADLLIHHPSVQPPRLRVEEAMLDHCDSATALAAVDLVLRATQRRCTTAERFSRAIGKRRRQRWRSLLLERLAWPHRWSCGTGARLSGVIAYRPALVTSRRGEVEAVAGTATSDIAIGTSSSNWTVERRTQRLASFAT